MFRPALVVCAAAFAAGCSDYLSPSGSNSVYILARIGPTPLPVFIGQDGGLPLLLADTLLLVQDRPRVGDSILTHVAVLRVDATHTTRSESEHYYTRDGGQLRYDECPVGSFCAAIIAMPRVFDIVGDSLFEVVAGNTNIQPRVYGRVRY
jgi:hypothetical protein